ncbi:hypothetical protein IGJ55_002143 [Enterococcus sp. AZ170]|uniref:hypothetical protein n=1 Tax=Enterococcus sp. AZ170 TaxID=2774747 RepID=UPI003D2FC649
MENKHFELRITWKDTCIEILAGFFIFFITLGIILWFLLPVFKNFDMFNRFFLFVLVIFALMSGVFYLAYLAISFSFMLIISGIYDVRILLKYHGVIYLMNEKGLIYYDNKQLHTKKWRDIIDVGCFKQQDNKVKILYKYQIKFADATEHEFNLRGTFPTKEFKDKIEEFWLFYNA